MILLDDHRWHDLQHCYGSAADIPDLLRAIATNTAPAKDHMAGPWSELWSRLCHQGDAYTASYAAVPHVVHIASQAVGPIDLSFFHMPVAIEIARQTGQGPAVLDEYVQAYQNAIESLPGIAGRHGKEPWSRSMVLVVAAAQAAAKGHIDIAEAMLNLDDDLIARINSGEID